MVDRAGDEGVDREERIRRRALRHLNALRKQLAIDRTCEVPDALLMQEVAFIVKAINDLAILRHLRDSGG